MISDIAISQSITPKPIETVAENLGIDKEDLELYGKYKAKLSDKLMGKLQNKKDGKLILVTAVNPTPAGEGKTTVTVGLGQAMAKIGKNAVIALREPSLGPVFGIKGGAAGGGYSQVIPMEDINLHFTGDMHAITSANNLLCALLDNHIHQGNALGIDQRRIMIKRCLDINDRALRHTIVGLGGKINGVVREDSFTITVASEVMAILCLSSGISDLKERLGKILVAYKFDCTPVFASDLNAQGAMAALLKDAIKPNLVQTLEGTPAIMHGGPFANIAHGCNSVAATKLALKLCDYVITEAGFGSDLGAEKFFDIKCRYANLTPDAVVIVSTVKALKYNGYADKDALTDSSTDSLIKGLKNLGAHIKNMKSFGVPVVVALNKFSHDTQEQLDIIEAYCKENNADFAVADVHAKGGSGGAELAKKVVSACEREKSFTFAYPLSISIQEKIECLAKNIYGADGVDYTAQALKAINEINALGGDKLPICVAKTQYSLSDNPKLLGRPENFRITVRNLSLSNGAGFVVVYLGDVMTMPGLPKKPAADSIDIDENGTLTGLF